MDLAVQHILDRRTLPGTLYRYGQALGVASFDLRGLPIRFLGDIDHEKSDWIETAFQALNLHFLLASVLRTGEMKTIRVAYRDDYDILIVYKQGRYVAALLHREQLTSPPLCS